MNFIWNLFINALIAQTVFVHNLIWVVAGVEQQKLIGVEVGIRVECFFHRHRETTIGLDRVTLHSYRPSGLLFFVSGVLFSIFIFLFFPSSFFFFFSISLFHAQVFWRTLVKEVHIFYSHTQWIFSWLCDNNEIFLKAEYCLSKLYTNKPTP